MGETLHKGTISFIHHDKQYVTIDYLVNDKNKTITGKIDEAKTDQKNRKKHQYRIGDEVNFRIKLSDRGDRMIAYDLKFLYNTALEKLVNKASVENRFAGFLKAVDDVLYVKERDSYIFFPLKLSKWENPPAVSAYNETISFKLVNLEKPSLIAAELFSHDYIPEYRKVLESFKNNKPIDATVSRTTHYTVYLDLFSDRVQAKLQAPGTTGDLKVGDSRKVKVVHVSSDRVIVEPV